MRNLTLLFLFFCGTFAFSQEWAPIGATWYYTRTSVFPNIPAHSNKYEVTGDTLIQGKLCRKIEKQFQMTNDRPLVEYTYEENDTVFFYDDAFSEFQILYDFNADSSDYWDIKVYDVFDPGDIDTIRVIVVNVDSININGFWLKELKVQSVGFDECNGVGYTGFSIIETIGDPGGLFNFQSFDCATNEYPYYSGLRCYDDTIIGHYETTGINGECELIVGMNEIQKSEIGIYPNPASDFTIVKGIEKSSYTVQIYSIGGRLILEENSESGEVLDISKLDSGSYILKIIENGSIIYTRRFAKI